MAIEAHLYSENLGFPMFGSQSQDWMVDSNGNGVCNGTGDVFNQFYFNVQQKQQQQQQLPIQSPPLNLCYDQSASVLMPPLHNNNNNNIMAYTQQSIAAQEAKQRQEIDQYLRLQNERLRLALQEQRKQQLALLVKKIESRTQALMRQKDEEIARAIKKQMELEDLLRNLEAENQAWQRVAQENEAMVMSLNNTLEEFRDRANGCVMEEDAQSCCGSSYRGKAGEEEEEEEEVDINNKSDNNGVDEEHEMRMVCKGCNSRNSCVLFLPCRHLCSCKACEAVLDACPVCRTPKKASIEALIF